MAERSSSLDSELAGIEESLDSAARQILSLQAEQRRLNQRKREILKALDLRKHQQEEEEITKYEIFDDEPDYIESSLSTPSNPIERFSGPFPWDFPVQRILQETFHIQAFRPFQREIINCILSKLDCLAILPTGYGKSLLFQLPALFSPGISLVISPLLALMNDQLEQLNALGIPAAILNSSTTKEESNRIYSILAGDNRHGEKQGGKSSSSSSSSSVGTLKILFLTPEKISQSKLLLNKLEKSYQLKQLSTIIIDEFHCCSYFGHDYRPDYLKLSLLRKLFPTIPIFACSATATEKVLRDCREILAIPNAILFKSPFNRENLYLSVYPKASPAVKTSLSSMASEMIEILHRHRYFHQSGIIYCYSRKECELLSSLLYHSYSLNCSYYHAELENSDRNRIHQKWLLGEIHCLIATNAFGIGINKLNVRYVFHSCIPNSPQNLWQEAGRAGRDGHRALTAVWYHQGDLFRQSCRVFDKQEMGMNLYLLIEYCENILECRRRLMAKYFSENLQEAKCLEMCDICERKKNGTAPIIDLLDLSESVIGLLAHLEESAARDQRVTLKQLVDHWKRKDSPIPWPPALSKNSAEKAIVFLLLQGVLKEGFHHTAYSTLSHLTVDRKMAERVRSGAIQVNFPVEREETGQNKPRRAVEAAVAEESFDVPDDLAEIIRKRSRSTSADGEWRPKNKKGGESVEILDDEDDKPFDLTNQRKTKEEKKKPPARKLTAREEILLSDSDDDAPFFG